MCVKITRRLVDLTCFLVGIISWGSAAFLFLCMVLAAGCSSSGGGHRAYSGPEPFRDPVLANLEAGARCAETTLLPRVFDPGRDHIEVEIRPGTNFREFWYGKDEWGRDVGGYLQLLSPWPLPDSYTGAFRLKCVLFCNPETMEPPHAVIAHEAGGHGNLVPSGVFDHPTRFRSCYPWWRLKADGVVDVDTPIGPSVIYGPDGQVLHECGPWTVTP